MEVQDIRFGGLKEWLCSCERRLTDFLEKRIDRLDELEQARLPFTMHTASDFYYNNWLGLVSTSPL